ncbi:helix-turn-helix domain-containing protein [Massilia sp. PWRC2]|uniref:helix-turn-helix domain-containing protein n=1 Tax=Massilia sp. PWRC2 TaxID=2804626 RepID=UPI003CEDB944
MRIKQNAPDNGGAQVDHAGGRGATGQSKVFDCGADHISKLVQELQANGLGLARTSGQVQNATLRKALAYLGPRGLGTYEGAAAGYPRLAARINDLRSAGWRIASRRENLIGPDGLRHEQVARYVLLAQPQRMEDGCAPC